MVQVDALDANRVLVGIMGQDCTDILQRRTFHELTEDGGATWTKLPSSDDAYYGMRQ